MIANPSYDELVRLGEASDWSELMADRRGFQREFVRLVSGCQQLSGRVLDIGCGGELPTALADLTGRWGTLDGVDPDPMVIEHPLLNQRWQGTFEESGVPDSSYDLAWAYNVLEHVQNPRRFFARLARTLKPGGVFWGLTPNRIHPFAILSRSIELIGLKGFARQKLGRTDSGAMVVNDYSAYYRCNSPGGINRAIRGLGFSRATYYFHPCVQWDTYFPRWLRWCPRGYDYVIGTRFAALMQIFIVRLEK